MGFYGNVVPEVNTNLKWDKSYGSLWAAKVHYVYDNIFYGRNILIEYSQLDKDMYMPAYINPNSAENYLYTDSENCNDDTRIRYNKEKINGQKAWGVGQSIIYLAPENTLASYNKNFSIDGSAPVIAGQIVEVWKNNQVQYWKCIGCDWDSNNEPTYARFKAICTFEDSIIKKNAELDNTAFGVSSYDSTVWQRLDTDGGEHYINIANLNTTFPEITIEPTAPIVDASDSLPAFGAHSGGTSYFLRMPTAWSFKVGAIDFNEAGFNPDKSNFISNPKNTIEIKPVKSGTTYYSSDKNNITKEKQEAYDTQEISINLQSVGNVISEAYDIIHGKNRDNGSDSLKGNLNIFSELGPNEIPMTNDSNVLRGVKLQGDSKINVTVADDTIAISHNEHTEATDVGPEADKELNFGDNFIIPRVHSDAYGHSWGEKYTMTLPTISLNNQNKKENDGGNLVTGLALTPDVGAFVASNANVGTLALTEYVNNTNGLILATDTINGAFKKLVDELATETANRENDTTAITSLDGRLTTEINDRKNAITQEATDRNAAINAKIEALDVADTAVEGQYVSQVVETDGKISVTRANLPDYSNKYDENTKLTYNDTEMTIGDLFAKVADLEARLAVLENPTV